MIPEIIAAYDLYIDMQQTGQALPAESESQYLSGLVVDVNTLGQVGDYPSDMAILTRLKL